MKKKKYTIELSDKELNLIFDILCLVHNFILELNIRDIVKFDKFLKDTDVLIDKFRKSV